MTRDGTKAHMEKHWTAYSGWAALVVTLLAAFWAWSSDRATLKEQVKQTKVALEVRTNFVDSSMAQIDKRIRDQGKALARIEEQNKQAKEERKEIRDTLRRIWGSMRGRR